MAAHRQGDRGLVLLAADGSVLMCDEGGARWLAELADTEVLAAVAREVPARAEIHMASGDWLIVRASRLVGDQQARTAVTLESAGGADLAQLVADACALSERERRVAQLVALGLKTTAIARRLQISPWTVQDHLKSLFEKTGVNTRGELVARLFFADDAPRLGVSEGPS